MRAVPLSASINPVSACAALLLALPALAGEPGMMTREVWNGAPGNNVADFSGSARSWQAADSVAAFPGAAAPSNTGDNYAARIRATITAPLTGDYTFWIASNNSSELLLSPAGSWSYLVR